MASESTETVGQVLSAIAATIVAGIGGVLAYLWRKLSAIDALSQRLDVQSEAIEDVVEKQDKLELEQNTQSMVLTEIKTDIKWIRGAVHDLHDVAACPLRSSHVKGET